MNTIDHWAIMRRKNNKERLNTKTLNAKNYGNNKTDIKTRKEEET